MKKTRECEQIDAATDDVRASDEHGENASRRPGGEPVTYAVGLFDGARVPAVLDENDKLRRIALSPAIQALWGVVLPLVGVRPSRPEEYAGVFKVEPGPDDHEATIYVDIPAKPYERGSVAPMERVVALSVKLSHDYRLLGNQYYCVDCETPSTETRH